MLTNFRTGLMLAACLALGGCGTMYVAQAARGQLQILNAREPIPRVLADPAVDPALKKRLEEVRLAREFAWRELGLPNNKSYTSYADLKREFVTWTVVATPEFSVEPREWCFPIVGCVAYRGYFRRKPRRSSPSELRDQGFDTMVGGVPAYSTLGKFNDPILNTMMSYGDDELASIIFHELSHQVVYIPDDTAFNEAFAVTVEQEGLARWLKSRGREADLGKYLRRRERQAESLALVGRYRRELAQLYQAPIRRQRDARAQVRGVRAAGDRSARARRRAIGTESTLAAELDSRPNNARLASLATYYECVPGFQRVLAEQGQDLPTLLRRRCATRASYPANSAARGCAGRAVNGVVRLAAGSGAALIAGFVLAAFAAAAQLGDNTVRLAPSQLKLLAEHRAAALQRARIAYSDRRLGRSYGYNASGISLSIYVYDYGVAQIPDGRIPYRCASSTKAPRVRSKSGGNYENVVLRAEWNRPLADAPDAPWCARAVYEFDRHGRARRLGVVVHGGRRVTS